ncbi:sensor histidine kinase [Flavobacterium cyanobacteriorum]|nr:ATP-binding protein [Flavobacterium cyanobacteriorum]
MIDKVALGIVIILLFVSMLVLFCFLLIKLYIHKIKSYTKLIYQKDIEFQKTLNTTILETQEQVLNNISQDLHDDAGQQLTYVNFMLENLKLDSPELNDVLQPLSMQISSISDSIRSLSHSLNNQMLMQQDFLKVLEAEVERLQKHGKMEVTYAFKGDRKKQFATDEKIVIYRIFQEVTNNIIKHAKAGKVMIKLSIVPLFVMVIADDGVGFDVTGEALRGSDGLGLPNIISRAALINYEVTIQSVTGKGTTITLSEKKN